MLPRWLLAGISIGALAAVALAIWLLSRRPV
jgi:hypothetical protein